MMDCRENNSDTQIKINKQSSYTPSDQCGNSFNVTVTVSSSQTHLYELKDGEGRSAVVAEYESDDAEELSVEAAVAQTEQEAAEQRHPETEPRHRDHSYKSSLNKQIQVKKNI